MIEIVNEGSDGSGETRYSLSINPYGLNHNKKLMARFSHRREDGLAECLRKAAEALDKRAENEGFCPSKVPPMDAK